LSYQPPPSQFLVPQESRSSCEHFVRLTFIQQ
jgi:hypothetical protein